MKKIKIRIRNAKIEDIPILLEIDEESWPGFRANNEMFLSRIKVFPEGQFVAVVDDKIVGSCFTQRINESEWRDRNFSWSEITDNGLIKKTHRQNGESMYGVGLAVRKSFRNFTVSQRLIIAGIQLAIRLNLKQIFLGSRIPSYHRYPHIPVEEYIRTLTSSGRLLDPELTLYKKFGGEPIRPLPNYMPDPQSLNFGVLIRWKNPFYKNPFIKWIAWGLPIFSKYL